MRTFRINFVQGLRYAAIFMVIGGLMGLFYGLIGGSVVGPTFAGMAYVGIFVMLNLPIALIFGIGNLFPTIFKKGSKRLQRYLAMSLSFSLVFLAYFYLLKISGLQVF